MGEKIQKTRWIEYIAFGVIACALLASGQKAIAQDATPRQTGIDPALLAKANAGDAAAQVDVGENYEAGKAVTLDLKQAAAWYQKAADKGNVSGETHLATLYRDRGKDFPRDMVQAAVWFLKAAEQGDVTAQGTMGTLYSMGQGVEQSYVEAYYWLDLAAAMKGPKQAQYAAYRQMMGAHITTDELAAVQDRETAWKTKHPR